MQTITIDTDVLTKKLEERGYSQTQIATAMEVFKELDVSSHRPPSSPSSNTSSSSTNDTNPAQDSTATSTALNE
jgi:uncharacterized protein Smg (DUF494 family)